MQNEPQFVKCRCQHCKGRIEFDAKDSGRTIDCPHCGKQTTVFITSEFAVDEKPNQSAILVTSNSISLTLGIIGVVIGVLALLAGWIPFLGLAVIPNAIIGLVLSVAGVVIDVQRKHAQRAVPGERGPRPPGQLR